MLLTCALALVPAALAAAPVEGQPVAVIGLLPGHAGQIAAIAAAGGTVVAAVGSRTTVAMPGNAAFLSRLRGQGYWLLFDARAVPGCVPAAPSNRGFHVEQHA